jgi:hypothetical protein
VECWFEARKFVALRVGAHGLGVVVFVQMAVVEIGPSGPLTVRGETTARIGPVTVAGPTNCTSLGAEIRLSGRENVDVMSMFFRVLTIWT